MALFDKTRQCTSSFHCRFRVVLITAGILMAIAIVAIIAFYSELG